MDSTLIYGPMFSGKSDKLITIYWEENKGRSEENSDLAFSAELYELGLINDDLLIFKPEKDTRTQFIHSRTGKTLKSQGVKSWDEILKYMLESNQKPKAIFVDEAQFLALDGYKIIEEIFSYLKQKNIDIYVSTLDRNFLGEYFSFFEFYQHLFKNHIFLCAVCQFCNKPAIFSNKYHANELVLTLDNLFDIDQKTPNINYVPVCSLHNLKKQ